MLEVCIYGPSRTRVKYPDEKIIFVCSFQNVKNIPMVLMWKYVSTDREYIHPDINNKWWYQSLAICRYTPHYYQDDYTYDRCSLISV